MNFNNLAGKPPLSGGKMKMKRFVNFLIGN